MDVPAIDFKVLRHKPHIFDSQWTKKVLMTVILCREFASYTYCLYLARYMFRKRWFPDDDLEQLYKIRMLSKNIKAIYIENRTVR